MLYLVPLPPYHVVQRNSITELMLISRQREWQVSKQKKWRRRGKFSLISISKAVSFWMLHHQLCPSWAVHCIHIILTGAVQLWDILLGFIWPRSSIWSYVSTMDYATDCKEICIQSKTRYSQQYACALCRKDSKRWLSLRHFFTLAQISKKNGAKSLSWSSFFRE
mgnify:CR=1 FL=1